MKAQDFQRASDAMTSIKFIREHYGSTVEGQRLMQEVLTILRGDGSNVFCANIADVACTRFR